MLKRWLREFENLSDTEEELVSIYEPKTRETLGDEEERLVHDIIDL